VITIRPKLGSGAALGTLALAAFLVVGLIGAYRYVQNYWDYRGYAPPSDPAWVNVHGTSTRFSVTSAALAGRTQPVDVYLPPGYAQHPQRRYPVLYLLHGSPGRQAAFITTVRMGVVEDELVTLHRARPMILVAPFGSTGTFADKEWANGIGRGSGWETFVSRDVVRAIDRRYRTIPAARGIAGLSEGGYGALNIAIHHPRQFRVVESWSGYQRAYAGSGVFGHRRSLLQANSPSVTISAQARTFRSRHVFVWFYSGSRDKLRTQNRAFAATLTRLAVPHRYFVVRGGHNWALWRANAERAYLAASKHIGHA
jgi:S-formylglutathione hydrolase FrmB